MFESIKQQLDDRGVSPVIGVILMVAITVILAAVIGSFVLGIGGDVEKAPQASIDIQDSNTAGEIDISHQGGDPLPAGTEVTVNGNDEGTIGPLSVGSDISIGVSGSGSSTVRLVDPASDKVVAKATVIL